jgi:hypothetical protein
MREAEGYTHSGFSHEVASAGAWVFGTSDSGYFVIVPQAMRSPAFPAGSVFRSSALA